MSYANWKARKKRQAHFLWKDIKEMKGGGFSDIEPGLYELVVTRCEPHENEQYFEIAWDVASGDRKGAYERNQYPPTTRIYWTERSLGFLKHRLHVLADWNHGFKSTVAFENDQWREFVGKHFGAVVRKRLYTAGPNSKNPGVDRHQMEIAAWLSPEDFEAKNFNMSLLDDNDMRESKGASQQQQVDEIQHVPQDFGEKPDVYDEDIPF